MLRKLYVAALATQYILWGFYVAVVVFVYLLGFLVDTLNIRWFLLPLTLTVVAVGVGLSFVVVVAFTALQVRREGGASARLGMLAPFPSFLIFAGAVLYGVGRLFH